MPEVKGEQEIKCKCPKCKHEFWVNEEVTLEFDWSEFAP